MDTSGRNTNAANGSTSKPWLFQKGWKGGPGRKPGGDGSRTIRREYLSALVKKVPLDEWEKVCEKALEDAKAGDAHARLFLAQYLMGRPTVGLEVSGPHGDPLAMGVIVPFLVKLIGRRPELREELAAEFRRLGLPGPPTAEEEEGDPVRMTPLDPLSDRDEDDGDGRDR